MKRPIKSVSTTSTTTHILPELRKPVAISTSPDCAKAAKLVNQVRAIINNVLFMFNLNHFVYFRLTGHDNATYISIYLSISIPQLQCKIQVSCNCPYPDR